PPQRRRQLDAEVGQQGNLWRVPDRRSARIEASGEVQSNGGGNPRQRDERNSWRAASLDSTQLGSRDTDRVSNCGDGQAAADPGQPQLFTNPTKDCAAEALASIDRAFARRHRQANLVRK